MTKKTLGLLPPMGGGLTDLQKVGQASRLIDIYFRTYIKHFDHVYYFSYFDEKLSDFTSDKEVLNKVTLVANEKNINHRSYALRMHAVHEDVFKKIDVFRVFQTPGGLPAVRAKKMWGIPYVTTYGFRYDEFLRVSGRKLTAEGIKILSRKVLKKASAIIYTNQEIHQQLVSIYKIPNTKLVYIPNGVDTFLFAPEKRKRSNLKKILYIGRLELQKNLFGLLDAVAQLDGVSLTIVGIGAQREDLESYANKLDINAKFNDKVDNTKLPKVFNDHDIFVLPSFIEGHPKILIEAMSSGIPVAVSDCEGNRALVINGVNGVIFDPGNSKNMAKKMQSLIDNPNEAGEYGTAAREFVSEHYNIHKLLKKETELLLNI